MITTTEVTATFREMNALLDVSRRPTGPRRGAQAVLDVFSRRFYPHKTQDIDELK